jgi:NADPH:quinone reductase-like Zn-dependent oxidoreductase
LSAHVVAKQGLLDVAKIKAGETLVVSGAAGHVGSLVCQIGKIYGAKVIGIAGTDEKCRWLREELKIDATLNYKSPSFHDDFKDTVGYFDVYFDNVGGEMLDFALTRLKAKARVIMCGELKRKISPNFERSIDHQRFWSGAISDYSAWTYQSWWEILLLTCDRALFRRPKPQGAFLIHEPHIAASENRRLYRVSVDVRFAVRRLSTWFSS